MELKKGYAGFVLWLLAFVAGMLLIALLPVADGGLLMRALLSWTAASLALLTFIIWRTEQVYWYNGTTWEAAEEVGSERRKAFAWRHFRVFGLYALVQLVFLCVMQLISAPLWIDMVVFCAATTVAALATLRIRL